MAKKIIVNPPKRGPAVARTSTKRMLAEGARRVGKNSTETTVQRAVRPIRKIMQGISAKIQKSQTAKTVKKATGVRNDSKSIKNTRATKPSQRLGAMNAGIRTSNKAQNAQIARGDTKLSSPSTKVMTSTDNIKSKAIPTSDQQRLKAGGGQARTRGKVRSITGKTGTDALKSRGKAKMLGSGFDLPGDGKGKQRTQQKALDVARIRKTGTVDHVGESRRAKRISSATPMPAKMNAARMSTKASFKMVSLKTMKGNVQSGIEANKVLRGDKLMVTRPSVNQTNPSPIGTARTKAKATKAIEVRRQRGATITPPIQPKPKRIGGGGSGGLLRNKLKRLF